MRRPETSGPRSFETVLLVGGTTRMPIVAATIATETEPPAAPDRRSSLGRGTRSSLVRAYVPAPSRRYPTAAELPFSAGSCRPASSSAGWSRLPRTTNAPRSTGKLRATRPAIGYTPTPGDNLCHRRFLRPGPHPPGEEHQLSQDTRDEPVGRRLREPGYQPATKRRCSGAPRDRDESPRLAAGDFLFSGAMPPAKRSAKPAYALRR